VFLISVYGDKNTVAAALDRGAKKFMTKPVDLPQLKQDITAVIEETQGPMT
jgi:DNA-binding response OmpR family regulator